MGVLQVEDVVRDGGLARVFTLNRPDRLNAISPDLLDALDAAVEEASRDVRVRWLVITGAGGRAFSAGADASAFSRLEAAEALALMAKGQGLMDALERCPKPVVAAIDGYALGGGLELALACDLRIASRSARLGQPEIGLANLPGWGGTQRLPRLVGEAWAKELILTGRVVDAEEAYARGLVHRVVDGPALPAALAFAQEALGHSGWAMGLAKQAILAARGGREDGYAVERLGVALCFGTEDQRRATARFAPKGREG